MATKPLLWCLPAAALAAVWAAGVPKARKGMVWASIGACVVFVPWLLKNIVFYGNPIYPFFHAWFQPRAAIMPNWHYLGENTGIPWFSAPRAALAAWLRAPFVAASYNHDLVQYANPILFGLLPAGLCLSLRERKFKIMLCFTMAAWLPISLATDLPRYFIPIFPALSLAAAAATQGSRWWRGTIAACLAVLGFTLWTGILPLERLAVFTGQESESDYLEHSHNTYPGPLYAAARWIDNNASKDARVLVFGDSRGFQVERDYFSSSPKQMTPLELWANASADGNALNVNLARENVKYILINHAEILRGGLAFSFTATGESALDQFWARYMRKVFETGPDYVKLSTGQQTLDRWVAVYEVLTEAEAAKRHVADAPFAAYKMRPL